MSEILHAWNLNPKLKHQFVIFATPNALSHLKQLDLDNRFRFVSAPNNRFIRILWQQFALPLWIKVLGVHVHWGPGFILPLLSMRPMVVTIHDMTFQLFPEVHEKVKRFYFPVMMKLAARKARAILVISKSTGDDLQHLIPNTRGKIHITFLAARDFSRDPCRIDEKRTSGDGYDYMLFLGTLEPRKNLVRLLSAWLAIDDHVRGLTKLRVVGATGWMANEIDRRFKNSAPIEFLGHLDDGTLVQLLRGAKAFLYPSLYEGFGLPVVEAMSLGVPVLTSNIGATKEVAGNAALLVDPTNETEIKRGLIRLLSEPHLRETLAESGRKRSSQFSWVKTARETMAVIEKIHDERL
ncbi:glycosyltransferase family 4 protein [Thiorhodovibrio winogradskyi]|uniref:glycosyltransferase family 4 protein n=1 Tax=Thiorhodovibrio winogradskyi TaxID=77007 RepID=UPI002E2A3DA0|nr:glycosyltransferase family 1 protein [Thiorhodovibrio winogradskyi]